MKKQHYIINMLFAIVWLVYFWVSQTDNLLFVMTYILNCWFVLPIIAAVYNYIVTKKGSRFILLSLTFSLSQVFAYICSNGILLTGDYLFWLKKGYAALLQPVLINALIFFAYTAFFFFIVWIIFVNKKEEKVEL